MSGAALRILVLILLTWFLALAALPQAGTAMSVLEDETAGHHAHGCLDCPEVDGAPGDDHVGAPECHHMAFCSAALLPGNEGLTVALATDPERFPLPAAETGAAVPPICDLPPPRV